MAVKNFNVVEIRKVLAAAAEAPLASNGVRATVAGEADRAIKYMSIPDMAEKLGTDPWSLDKRLNTITDFYRDEGQGSPGFTLAPHRSRVAYGLPEALVPVVKGDMPDALKARKRKSDPSKAATGKQYWGYVLYGEVTPLLAEGTESTYDGRFDEYIEAIEVALNLNNIPFLSVKGRNVRGGGGIYIAMESSKSEDSNATEPLPTADSE